MPRNDREFRHALGHFVIGVAGAQRARADSREREFVISPFSNPLSVLSCLGGALRSLGLFDRTGHIGANVLRRSARHIQPLHIVRPMPAFDAVATHQFD